jgi:hypothetical protein
MNTLKYFKNKKPLTIPVAILLMSACSLYIIKGETANSDPYVVLNLLTVSGESVKLYCPSRKGPPPIGARGIECHLRNYVPNISKEDNPK